MFQSTPFRFDPKNTTHQRNLAVLLCACYIVLHLLSSQLLPRGIFLYPESALALAALYFGGLRFFPLVYLSALIAHTLAGNPLSSLISFPLIEVAQATMGAYLLRKVPIDPLFRRHHDVFYFLGIIIGSALIAPTLHLMVDALTGTTASLFIWRHEYIGGVASLLIVTPFILRWCTKPGFSRTPTETLEVVAVFGLLIGINVVLFRNEIQSVYGVHLAYLLFIPLFWIALRLRPRFVTLALVLIALSAALSALANVHGFLLAERLLEQQVFLIVLAITFLIITTLEEDRRATTNLTRSQLATLNNAISTLSSETKAKNDFIATLAHELRNPLAPVTSSIEFLRVKRSIDPEDYDMLDMMANRMEVVRRLLEDLLDISRISEGKITLERNKVNMESMLRHAILSTDHHRKELHQQLILQMPRDPVFVSGDALRLEQTFSNLLTNASTYSRSGDTITLLLTEEGDNARIEVSDEGIGLEPHELESIFLPFHQGAHGERSKKGLGIGLSLVHNFVRLHDGTIEVASSGHGKGSRFTVRLPLLKDEG